MWTRDKKYLGILLAGDILALIVITMIGFGSHGNLLSAGPRLLTTFIPLLVGWFLIAPFFGLYLRERTSDIRQLWRPGYVVLIGAPLAAWLRGLMLNSPVMLIFVAVLGASGALAMIVWRFLFLLIDKRING